MKNTQINQMIDRAINQCLPCIRSEQNTDGGFSSIFSTALILCCLKEVRADEISKTILDDGLQFLIREKSDKWSWNYWPRTNDKNKKTLVPDDLDDTCAALSALSIYRPELFGGEVLASVTKLLLSAEIQPGGPYNTWLIDFKKDTRWHDVDPAVHANIAFFLSMHGISLPGIENFLEHSITEENFTSKYYDKISILYFISRFYKGTFQPDMRKNILRDLNDGVFENDILRTSLACSAYMNFSDDSENITAHIKAVMNYCLSGNFEAIPFYVEEHKGAPTYYKSKGLTAAFCLEALTLYRVKILSDKKDEVSVEANKKTDNVYQQIVSEVENRICIFSPEINERCSMMLKKMLTHDSSRQISLLPFFTAHSFKDTFKHSSISDQIIISLGCANLFGWLGYKIYDDIMDNEGDSLLLPVANLCLRETSILFNETFERYSCNHIFSSIMDTMEKANAWERLFCYFAESKKILRHKIPDYGNLSVIAEKSFAHALGPLSLFINAGLGPDTDEFKNLHSFFKQYLLARQLNDDAHDWEKDFRRGFFNSVSVRIVARYMEIKEVQELSLSENEIGELQHIFWSTIITEVYEQIFLEIKNARIALGKLQHIVDPRYFESLLLPIEHAADEALREKQKVEAFMKSYV